MIYAIEAIGLDRVKFGKAKDPEARCKILSTASPVPLQLIIVAPWPDIYEGVIHRAFSEERITGEWFLATKRVEKFCHVMGAPASTDSERFLNSMAYIDRICSAPSVMPKVRLMSQSLTEMAEDVLRDIEGSAEKQLEGSAIGVVTPGQDQSGKSAGLASGPLTPAEKQKAYRERHGDKARAANKLRMRKSRDADRGGD